MDDWRGHAPEQPFSITFNFMVSNFAPGFLIGVCNGILAWQTKIYADKEKDTDKKKNILFRCRLQQFMAKAALRLILWCP